MNVNRELLAFLRKQYPVGTRIRLDSMQDPYAPVEAGTTGKLDYIDDAGQFHMKWDNGRTLALIPGVDSFTVLPPELSMTKLYMPLNGTFSPVALRCDMRTEFIQNRFVLRNNFAPSPIRNPFQRDFPCQAELLEHRRRFAQILISSSANLPLLILQSSLLCKLNFYVQADFDVDAAFGTFVCTDENNDWLNIYANYDIARDRPCDTLELNLCKGDGTEENWSYHLNAAEQEVLARKMEAFCQQQNGMSLHDFARQLQEEPGPSPQIQM